MRERIGLLVSNRQFLRLWIGLTQSQLGTLINLIALSLYVYDKTRSGAAVGFLEIAMAIPSVVIGVFAGVIVDRYSRKWVMVISDVVRALLFLIMAFTPSIPAFYVIVFASTLVGLFFSPAYSASLPMILGKKALLEANSLREMSSQLVRIVGPGLAGIMYAQFGFTFVCVFNTVTYFISAVVILSIPIPQTQHERREWKSMKAPWLDAIEGFRQIRSNSLVKWVLVTDAGMQLGAGAIVVLAVIFVKELLNGSDALYGMIISATAVGSFVGAFVTWFRGRLSEEAVLRSAYIALGLSLLLISLCSHAWIALILFAIVGVSQTLLSITIDTVLQKHVHEAVMGRTFATMGVLGQLSQLLSMGAGGILADIVGIRAVYVGAGIIVCCAALLASRFVCIPASTAEVSA